MLTQPIRWRKPRTIFVCSMTDLFADFVPVEWIDRMFAVMALTPWHTYQVLTKRAQRMHDVLLLVRATMGSETLGAYECIYNAMGMLGRDGHVEPFPYRAAFPNGMPWPLPNVWLGVSAERQQEADERIPLLLQTPAAVRFISAEPLLGPIDLSFIRLPAAPNALTSSTGPNLDWVIAGGESGSTRAADASGLGAIAARSVRAAGVPFFFKQWGEWAPSSRRTIGRPGRSLLATMSMIHRSTSQVEDTAPVHQVRRADNPARVGKKAAGRLLDGVEHNGFPQVPA
jgi:protein gp37